MALAFSACTGVMTPDDKKSSEGGGGAGGVDEPREGGSGGHGDLGPCAQAPAFIDRAPIARLTNLQYRNTLRTLFPSVAMDALSTSKETRRREGFYNQGEAQNPSPKFVEEIDLNAENVANAVVAELPGSVGCTAPVNEIACGSAYVKTLLERAFRRPPNADELQRFVVLFTTSHAEFGFGEAIGLVVRAVLQSPNFLYRVEKGIDPNAFGTKVALTAYEVASRLSYFLSNNMPDGELAKAAETGSLLKDDELAKQAKRLMASTAARQVVTDFQDQWLHLDRLDTLSKSATLHPEFNSTLKASYKTSLQKFLEYQTWEGGGGRWRELFTDKTAFVDADVGKIYGVTSTGSNMRKVTLDDKRAGLLSQAGLLATLAHVDIDSPTKRGVFVLENVLCQHVPEPPPGTSTEIPKVTKSMTVRQRMEEVHASEGACKGCHALIDGIGFGFSNFDSLGRYRTQDSGLPTDDRGNVVAGLDVDGEFRGVVELSEKIASSQQGPLCYASQILAYGRGLARSDFDACAAEQLLNVAGAMNPSLQDLMLAVTASEGFRLIDKSPLKL